MPESHTFSLDGSILEALISIPVIIITGFTLLFFIYRLRIRVSRSSPANLPHQHSRPGVSNSSKLKTGSGEEDFSKCNSPGCVRCKNYKNVKENLKQKLDEYLYNLKAIVQGQNDSKLKFSEAEPDMFDGDSLQRLKMSVELNNEAKSEHNRQDLNAQSNPTIFQLHGLSTKPWYERNEVREKDVKLLEDSFSIIWEEFTQVYDAFLQGDSSGWMSNSVPTGQWNVFHLYNQGTKVTSNCVRCPGTARTLKNLDTFMCNIAFGNATFTVLQAGTHITEHYGPCNLRIRCHLGLQIPSCCSLTVATKTRHWIEESCLLFDDSYLHEAKHEGLEQEGPRIVFMVDLWSPEITEEEKSALKYLFTI